MEFDSNYKVRIGHSYDPPNYKIVGVNPLQEVSLFILESTSDANISQEHEVILPLEGPEGILA